MNRSTLSMKRTTIAFSLAVIAMLGVFVSQAYAGYLGDGYWPSSSLNWTYDNIGSYSNYSAPTATSIADWDNGTELTLTEVFDSSWDVK